MTVLPIVERELRVTARRRNTYWIRVVLALVVMAIGGWILLAEGYRAPQRLGAGMFVAMSVFAFVYCLLAGLRATADCLSEEKREGTLGLLFLTDLKGYDIVLGKLVATSLNVLCGLLAMVPVMTIPLLAGSVAVEEVGRVALVALNSLFFSLAAGLFASAVCREERRAMGLCFAIIASLTLLLPLIGGLVVAMGLPNFPLPIFFIPSPGYACFMAFDDTYHQFPSRNNFFLESVLVVHASAWTFLGLSCLIAPRSWQEEAVNSRGVRWREGWQSLTFASSERRQRFRAALLEANPFYWLAARERFKPVLVWLFLAVSAGLWYWGWLAHDRSWLDEPTFVFTGLALNSVLKIWIAGEAGWRFSVDRNSGALELVLSTPLKVTEIIRGQVAALFRQFAAPAAVVVVVELLFLQARRGDESWVLVCVAGLVMFVADLITLSWVGMWLGVSNRHHSRALGATIGLVLVLPWVLFALFATYLAVASTARPSGWDVDAFTIAWLVIGLINDWVLALWARARLRERFRVVVTERFAAAKGTG
jgi:ABC-type transport system involved in cytochrome c biogenesis permease component